MPFLKRFPCLIPDADIGKTRTFGRPMPAFLMLRSTTCARTLVSINRFKCRLGSRPLKSREAKFAAVSILYTYCFPRLAILRRFFPTNAILQPVLADQCHLTAVFRRFSQTKSCQSSPLHLDVDPD